MFKINVNPKYSHNSIDMDIDTTRYMHDIKKMNQTIVNKLSTYYHFLCFSICCACVKSAIWRGLFCLRAARVNNMDIKLD